MIDFATARRMMVDSQVRTSDVTDPRLIAAMLDIPRERFVSESEAALTYLDFDEHNLLATSFTLKNPHAKSTCGCGESFTA